MFKYLYNILFNKNYITIIDDDNIDVLYEYINIFQSYDGFEKVKNMYCPRLDNIMKYDNYDIFKNHFDTYLKLTIIYLNNNMIFYDILKPHIIYNKYHNYIKLTKEEIVEKCIYYLKYKFNDIKYKYNNSILYLPKLIMTRKNILNVLITGVRLYIKENDTIVQAIPKDNNIKIVEKNNCNFFNRYINDNTDLFYEEPSDKPIE